tara:strand:- start:590 stop:1219 length:630 start_codon:yes stop_codon:yes gene_type:complete
MRLQKTCILLANGTYPNHSVPLDIINKAEEIICLDGAADKAFHNNLNPSLILGDLDSISENLKRKYSKIIIETPDQNKNDLEKGLDWIENHKYTDVTIIGATGLRDDHTLSNIFIIMQKSYTMNIKIVTDFGTFQIINGYKKINSFKGQKVSLFALKKDSEITTSNLKYNLNRKSINTLFSATLNESKSSSFSVEVDKGSVLLYKAHLE